MTGVAPMTGRTRPIRAISGRAGRRDRRRRGGPGRWRGAARYSALGRQQQVPDLDADEIVDALADDVMAEGDLGEALRRLMERGWRRATRPAATCAGLRDLMDRLARRREEILERYQLADVLGDIRQELDEIVARGTGGRPAAARPRRLADGRGDGRRRTTSREMLRDIAAKRLDQLDALPPDVGEPDPRPPGLRLHGAAARERFDELVERLRGRCSTSSWPGMSDAIKGMTPEDLAANREMVRDLNGLLRERLGGGEPGRVASSSPSTAGSSRARRPSTTSSSSSPSGWPRCSRCCAR